MRFQEFNSKITKLEHLELPGEKAQLKLAPVMRIEEMEKIDPDKKNPNKAGVLAVFYPNENDETFLALILRKTYRGVHSNQVGFPGGRVEESDRNLKHTALRETEEEIGIPQSQMKVIKKLSRLYIPPSNFWVYPYVGITYKTPVFVPQESEVEEILEVDIDDFMSENSLISERLSTSYAREIDVPAFKLRGKIVWGATAMILSELKDLLNEVL